MHFCILENIILMIFFIFAFKVKRVVIHKDYKASTFENDIAILELETPIERQPHIVPICMPKDNNEQFLGRMGIVTGWGRLEYGKLIS